ncbi:MAG: ComF family protein, partial [Marinirhabdus sp.]
ACHHRTGDREMANIFYGRFPIEHATALFRFQKKGISQKLLHQLKYRKQEKISGYLGEWLGEEIAGTPYFKNVDMVVPVPLHKQRQRKRGYNQVAGFGKAIAQKLGVPYRDDLLLKVIKSKSQVFKQRFTRFEGNAVFTVTNPGALERKHILLVDDIVTTGATLEKCAEKLLHGTGAKLSACTMAMA